MTEATQTPEVQNPPVETEARAPQAEAVKAPSKASPAQDLRDIQNLLLMGIYPGNVAPAVVKGYQLLEQMARQVEASVESK